MKQSAEIVPDEIAPQLNSQRTALWKEDNVIPAVLQTAANQSDIL